jgi:hypothetical protein
VDDGTYLAFLVLGVVLVAVDAVIIYRSGLRYLADSYADTASSKSMARLVTTLFSFAVLGVLALLSTISLGGDSAVQSLVMRLGVVLILLAVAHGITIKVLTRLRDRLDAENKTKAHYGPPASEAGPAAGERAVGGAATPRVRDVRP